MEGESATLTRKLTPCKISHICPCGFNIGAKGEILDLHQHYLVTLSKTFHSLPETYSCDDEFIVFGCTKMELKNVKNLYFLLSFVALPRSNENRLKKNI